MYVSRRTQHPAKVPKKPGIESISKDEVVIEVKRVPAKDNIARTALLAAGYYTAADQNINAVLFGISGIIHYVNPAFTKLTGYSS